MKAVETIDDGANVEIARHMRANMASLLARMKGMDIASPEHSDLLGEYLAESERERKLWSQIRRRFNRKMRVRKSLVASC